MNAKNNQKPTRSHSMMTRSRQRGTRSPAEPEDSLILSNHTKNKLEYDQEQEIPEKKSKNEKKLIDDKNEKLLEAVSNGSLNDVKRLIESGANVNVRDKYGATPLFLSIYGEHIDIINTLLNSQFTDVNLKNGYGETPLYAAVETDNEDVVKAIVEGANEKGLDLNLADTRGKTPLHIAARENNPFIIEYLMTCENIQPDMQDDEMKTALHIAAENNYSEAIDAFYNSKMNSNITDRDGRTPLYTAAELGHVHSVQSITYYMNPDNNAVDRDGKTPLYIAAEKGHSEVVKFLLTYRKLKCSKQARPEVNKADKDGKTPLYIAAEKGHSEVVKILLYFEPPQDSTQAKTNVNQADNDGKTPLYIAAQKGKLNVIYILLQFQGTDIEKADKNGITPFMTAYKHSNLHVVFSIQSAQQKYNHLQHLRMEYNVSKTSLKKKLDFFLKEKKKSNVVETAKEQNAVIPPKKSEDCTYVAVDQGQANTCYAMSVLLLFRNEKSILERYLPNEKEKDKGGPGSPLSEFYNFFYAKLENGVCPMFPVILKFLAVENNKSVEDGGFAHLLLMGSLIAFSVFGEESDVYVSTGHVDMLPNNLSTFASATFNLGYFSAFLPPRTFIQKSIFEKIELEASAKNRAGQMIRGCILSIGWENVPTAHAVSATMCYENPEKPVLHFCNTWKSLECVEYPLLENELQTVYGPNSRCFLISIFFVFFKK